MSLRRLRSIDDISILLSGTIMCSNREFNFVSKLLTDRGNRIDNLRIVFSFRFLFDNMNCRLSIFFSILWASTSKKSLPLIFKCCEEYVSTKSQHFVFTLRNLVRSGLVSKGSTLESISVDMSIPLLRRGRLISL